MIQGTLCTEKVFLVAGVRISAVQLILLHCFHCSEKQRKPAWCDRVLWLVQKDAFAQVIASLHDKKIDTDLYVKLNYYNSLPQYKNSDHKPVVAGFTCRVCSSSSLCEPG